MIKNLLSSFADEFHRLDRAVFQRDETGGARAVQFTSSRRSEGVTTVVLAFAGFMAQLHGPEELIIVEANFRNPSIAQILGLTLNKNLSTVLTERKNPDPAIHRDPIFGISVIPAAPVTDGTMIEPILENVGDLLAELRKKYRYILLDSPPAMPFIDANIISGSTDGVVIVVESNATPSEVLNDAIERLKSGGAPILGVILNKREFHIPKWLYRLL